MDEPTQSREKGRQSAARRSADDRSAITSPPAIKTHESVAEQTAAAASGISANEQRTIQGEDKKMKDGGNGIVGRVRERAGAQLTNQKDMATDGIRTIAQAVRKSTQDLRDQRHETLAEYVERAADQLERLSSGLKGKDIGEMFRDAQNVARRQPGMFVGSAFALGLLGARFLKSSAPQHQHRSWQQRTGSNVNTSPAHMGYRYSEASAYGQAAPGAQGESNAFQSPRRDEPNVSGRPSGDRVSNTPQYGGNSSTENR
jgi:hypothetical protein